jgi:hypothetical protein
VTESVVNTGFPELQGEIGLRNQQYQRQPNRARRGAVRAEIREIASAMPGGSIVRALRAQGICPSVPRVTSRLKSGSLREWTLVNKVVADARKELLEG